MVAKAGQTPLSSFVRDLALDKVSKQRALPKRAPVKDHVALAQILAMLGRANLFSNLTGLDRAAKLGIVDLDDDAKSALAQSCQDIANIKALLMSALGINEQ